MVMEKETKKETKTVAKISIQLNEEFEMTDDILRDAVLDYDNGNAWNYLTCEDAVESILEAMKRAKVIPESLSKTIIVQLLSEKQKKEMAQEFVRAYFKYMAEELSDRMQYVVLSNKDLKKYTSFTIPAWNDEREI